MTRYMIDKLLLDIDRSDESVAAFRADPARFLEVWEASARSAVPPNPGGGELSAEERTAFCPLDPGRLYAMGAHPYLLWHVVRTLAGDADTGEVSLRFVEAVKPFGYPDFST